MGFSDYLNGPKYKLTIDELRESIHAFSTSNEQLKLNLDKLGGLDLIAVQDLIAKEQEALGQLRIVQGEKLREIAASEQSLASLRQQILVVEENLLLESFALYVPKFSFAQSVEYKDRLEYVRSRQKEMVKSGRAATGNKDWTVNNSKAEGRKLVNDMIKLVIRSFNNEADYCVDNVKFNNIELGEKRIDKSFETLNKLGRIMNVSISQEYCQLKLDELHLAHEYQVKKQEEKEEAKRIREELREQQKLEQEIRAAREKIAKERKHFEAAIKDLQGRLAKASDQTERANIEAKLAEITAGCQALDNEERQIDYREQNAKAGYVYVISNIGAFGDGIYKIGMTRRLEPQERVDELGDASVPFGFDVHAMVFSDNAPALENKLHQAFQTTRLNKVNHRKEFFRADIKDIESIIRASFDATVEFSHEAPADQYRESIRMAS